jgi:16S rRNA (cytidine1402-2'-O)-methyltransferase
MINALICSGIDTTEFMFLGFLPLNKKLRKEKLEEIRCATKTIILYEAPHKMKNTLKDLKNYIEGRKLVLVRELTKIHEEFIRKPIDELITEVENLKGEMILVIEGGEGKVENLNNSNDLSIEEQYKIYEAQGLTKNEIIKKIAKDRKTTKNEIYQMFIEK